MKAKTLLLVGLTLGSFLVVLDINIVNVALAVLHQQLGGDIRTLQWAIDAYTIGSAGFILGMGAVADKFGAKRVYLAGLAAFGITSLLCGLAWSANTLIIFRLLMGIAGSLLLPASLALINHEYTVGPARAKALGVWASLAGLAVAAGPLAGGVLTHLFGWRIIFLINIPLCILGILLVGLYARETSTHDRPLQLGRQTLLMLFLVGVTFLIIESRNGLLNTAGLVGALGTVIAGLLFLHGERSSEEHVLVPEVFKHPRVLAASACGAVFNFGMFGLYFFLSLYLQAVLHYSVLHTGLAFLAIAIPTTFNPPLAVRFAQSFGAIRAIMFGFSCQMLAAVLQLVPKVRTYYPLDAISFFLLGYGATFVLAPLTTLVMALAPSHREGITSGFLNFSRQIGTVLGIAAVGVAMGSLGADMNIGLPVGLCLGALALGLITAWQGLPAKNHTEES
ncbi:MAG TPA: MFS transporter [Candidatus Saccharimonadales bacterium]|nr:MFS transporter [Candidatus Saccharimonadales bacterium]